MRIKFFVAALALAAVFFAAPATNDYARASEVSSDLQTQPRIDIARIKSVLKLTPEQQAYWPPVEAALRKLARASSSDDNGFVKRISSRVTSFVLDSSAIARIGAAARPLIKMLDDRQKQDAIRLVQEMGLGPVLTALL